MGKKNNNKSSTDSNNKSAGVDTTTEVVPEEFKRVIYDFINDFSTTFPEYSDKLEDHFTMVSVVNDDGSGEKTERIITDDNNKKLYEYCKSVYPSRFFDILYKNGDMFKVTNDNGGGGDDLAKIDAYFLPNIDFIKVWNTPDISDNIRNTIWKYLQLILFSIITNISDRDSFGETAKLFEAINEDELKTKLEETFKNMQDMFMGSGAAAGAGAGTNGSKSGETGEAGENTKFDIPDMKEFEKFAEHFKNFSGENGNIDMSSFPGFPGFDFKNASQSSAAGGDASAEDGSKKQPDIPNPEAIHEHISKLLNGKIGSLAKEIAEETAGDLDLGVDFDNPENINMGNVFQKLFKNPGKLMNMVKNVGKKLDDKFKNGDIKESEIMQEASEMLSNMKNMPGMGNLSSMLNQLGMSGLGGLGGLAGLAGLGGKGGKVNMGALQSHFQQNMKQAKMKERMQSKLQQRQQQQQQQPAQAQAQARASVPSTQPSQVRPTTSVFKAGEQIQQTPRPMGGVGLPVSQSETSTDNKMFTADNADNADNTDVAHKKKKKKNKNKK
jgi:hypothetical protein